MSLAAVVRILGGDLYDGGRRANVPGPGHGPADRSVSLLLSGDRVIAHSFAGDDWREVMEDLRRRGLVDAAGRVGAGRENETARRSAAMRQAAARGLWRGGLPIVGTLSERHCRQRAVTGDLPPTLRHHPGVPAAVYAEEGPRRPALLAAIQRADGALAGVEVTYLAPSGTRARLSTPRKTVGLCPAGAAVRLAPTAPELLVAEGVFTALSASARFGMPAWALLSVRNLRVWRPPDGVRRVLIAADRGGPGQAAASTLRRRLMALGPEAQVWTPPAPWDDWNAVAQAEALREQEEGRRGTGEADGWSGPPAREILR